MSFGQRRTPSSIEHEHPEDDRVEGSRGRRIALRALRIGGVAHAAIAGVPLRILEILSRVIGLLDPGETTRISLHEQLAQLAEYANLAIGQLTDARARLVERADEDYINMIDLLLSSLRRVAQVASVPHDRIRHYLETGVLQERLVELQSSLVRDFLTYLVFWSALTDQSLENLQSRLESANGHNHALRLKVDGLTEETNELRGMMVIALEEVAYSPSIPESSAKYVQCRTAGRRADRAEKRCTFFFLAPE